jgi:hypothetical protein
MKYTAAILILIFCLILYLSFVVWAQDSVTSGEDSKRKSTTEKKTMTMREDDRQEMDDDDYFADDQDIFSRKLFQKKLTPLSTKEKIIWAFRLSETNTFL